MFQGIFRRAELAVDSVVAKYVGRVTVAVPLIVAAGFATAALTVKLVELYGAVTAYALMAALFAVLGMLTAAFVGIRPVGQEEAPAEAAAGESSESVKEVENLLTPEVRAVLATAAPMALPAVARVILRNLPLVVLLAIATYIVSRFADTTSAGPLGSEVDDAAAAATAAAA